MKKNAIIVTGSAGFIGFNVSLELLRQGNTVVGIDNLNSYYHPAIKEARSGILHKYPNFIEKRVDISNLEELADNKEDLFLRLPRPCGGS